MQRDALCNAASLIVRGNLTPNTVAAFVHWNEDLRHLRLHYRFENSPNGNDVEAQEISMMELLAEFSEVLTAECTNEVNDTSLPELLDANLLIYTKGQS